MKKLGLIMFGMILGAGCFFFVQRGMKHGGREAAEHRGAKQETEMVADIMTAMKDSISYYRNALGQEVAEKSLIQGNAATIKLFYKKREDSICKVLHLRNAQLKDMVDVVSRVEGGFETETHVSDGSEAADGTVPAGWKGYTFSYSDEYLDEKGYVDSLHTRVEYSMVLPVSITSYWRRKWFLGKKHWYIDGYSPNKHVHITGLSGISINR